MNRTFRQFTIGALASTAVAAASLAPALAHAATTDDQVVTASKTGAANPDLRLSQDGYNVIRDIRAARVAIFNGDSEAAKKFVEEAKSDLKKVKSDDMIAVKKDSANTNPDLVPIDGQLFVADNFTTSSEKARHIADTNKKIKEGKADEAMQDLKLANVDVGFTRVLMPLAMTQDHVTTAYNLLEGGSYYEANMALKAAEDGLQVDTVMLVKGNPTLDKTSTGSIAKPAAK
ncbi:MAG: YfdX family protein [Oricola sp.]